MNFLTDTSVVSPLMRGELAIFDRLNTLDPSDLLYTSVISEGELEFGLRRIGQQQSGRYRDALTRTLALFADVLTIDRSVSLAYAAVKDDCTRKGRIIPDNDMWIAGVAIANDLTLVHRDHHFTFIPGLSQADWTKP